MNNFKKWLIRKLGGCVYLEQSQKIVYKTLPCSTFHVDITLPPMELNFLEEDIADFIYREAAEKIGRYIIDNGLYEITHNYDIEFNREKVRYKIRVVQPPNAPQLLNEYGSIDELHNDPNAYKTAIKFYGLDGD